ncbi:MAG: proline dehydrogenase family protein [Acidimicrobiales bacterium]
MPRGGVARAGQATGAGPGVAFEADVTALARQIAELGSGRAGVYHLSWWSERMLSWAMANPSFKTQLFRLVDVFPATVGDSDTLRHIHEYFAGADAPRLLEVGMDVASRVPGGEHVSASVARRNISRMAEQFIIGTTPEQVAARVGELWRSGSAATVDLLGEKTLTQAEADAYAARVRDVLAALASAAKGWPGAAGDRGNHTAPAAEEEPGASGDRPLPAVSVSLKPTALSPHFAPLTGHLGVEEVTARVAPILEQALAAGALVWLDMESYDVKDLTLDLFEHLVGLPGMQRLQIGIVVQAYLKDSLDDLARVTAASAARVSAGGEPLWVRLVKGAYWDAEMVHARAEGWAPPTYVLKEQSDASYERCTRLLHDHHGEVRAAFASHNLRSLAHAVVYARARGIPDSGYELQMLYGMAEPVHEAIRRLGLSLRVYSPMGELVPGMSYLVRRLLENTSNESFVRQRFADNKALDQLLAGPVSTELPAYETLPLPRETLPTSPTPNRPDPRREWRRKGQTEDFASTLGVISRRLLGGGAGDGAIGVPAMVGGTSFWTPQTIASVNPARPSMLVAESASASVADADSAVETARHAFEPWAHLPAAQRAAVLFKAAAWMRHHKSELGCLEVLEAGKPWPEADADVCEAIDFLEYYGREMLRAAAGGRVESPPGEANSLHYRGKGVAVVISPWNFPLAIPTGMVAASLVAGNTVVLKPAEQTPAMAAMLVEAFVEAGLPPGVLNLLPGDGEVVGDHLVRHLDVAVIAFTGSLEVGLSINATAAAQRPGQRTVKRVVAEMGGKNAIVVDADADLDQAVPAICASAFAFAGQKCSAASRVVVVSAVADRLVERLVGAAASLVVGDPSDRAVTVGPLIDQVAMERVQRYAAMGRAGGTAVPGGAAGGAAGAGTAVLARRDVPGEGYFVGPHIFDHVSAGSALATEEIFGPVLAVLRAGDFEEALGMANDTGYALTAGVFSRSPSNIALAAEHLRGGNVYVNRGITGAVPGRQPFGGYGLSGVGSKAGGPDYLFSFLDPRVVTENTMRQGFAPDFGEPGGD